MAIMKVDITCPCGKIHGSKSVGATHTASGEFKCMKCKKMVSWKVDHGKFKAEYK